MVTSVPIVAGFVMVFIVGIATCIYILFQAQKSRNSFLRLFSSMQTTVAVSPLDNEPVGITFQGWKNIIDMSGAYNDDNNYLDILSNGPLKKRRMNMPSQDSADFHDVSQAELTITANAHTDKVKAYKLGVLREAENRIVTAQR